MHKFEFKIPMGIMIQDKYSGVKGFVTAQCQKINGCVQVAVQPPCREDFNYKPEALLIDELSVELTDDSLDIFKSWTHEFAFETGDRVKHRINGFEGIIISRTVYVNKCNIYEIEAKLDKEGKPQIQSAWEAELRLVDKGLNAPEEAPVKRARTGGPDSKFILPD